MVLEDANLVMDCFQEQLTQDKCVLISHSHRYGVDMHGHAFLELSYIVEGDVEHTLDGKVERLSRGDYLIVDYGSVHSYCNLGERAFVNIDCLFLPELLDPALKRAKTLRAVLEHYLLHFTIRSPMQDPAHLIFHDEDGRVLELIGHIRRELEHREAGFTELVRCYLVEIFLLTLRQLEDTQTAMASDSIGTRMCAYVAEHYREEVTLARVALQMNYSIPYLSKRFKEETGVGFSRYLQEYRVGQACRLLVGTSLSFGEISERVGYRDAKNFAAVFKASVGMSPVAFRKNRQKFA